MSNAAEPIELDESILNHEENQVDNNIDLNDDQIALLLGDGDAGVTEDVPKEAVPSEGNTSDVLLDEKESAPEAVVVEDEVIHEVEDEVIHEVEDEVIHEVEDEVVHINEDEVNDEVVMDKEEVLLKHPEALNNEAVPEIVLDDDDVIMENCDSSRNAEEKETTVKNISLEDIGDELLKHPESDDDLIIDESADQEAIEDGEGGNNNRKEEDSNGSRKRAVSNGALRSPVPKRKRRVHTYFATRQAAINLVTQILGSYDGTLYRKDLQLLTDFNVINKEQMLRANQEHVKRLRIENKKLREQLTDEKRAHQVTLRKLLSIDKEMQDMRDCLKALMPMLTQPCTPEVEQRQFPKNYHMPTQPHHREIRLNTAERLSIPLPQPRPFIPRRAPAATSSSSFYAPSSQTSSPVTPMRILSQATQYRPVAAPPARRVSQRGGPPAWQHIPLPTTNLGHEHAINMIGTPQNLKDDTDVNNANTIMLCVPFIQTARIFPFIDRPAMIPHRFKSLTPSAHLSVVINSTADDFRENWQIGGRVSYEKLKNLHKKKIQVFVQVASFKACGMGAHLPMSNDPIEWGISSAWPCKPKMHKFRIRFHQQQHIPLEDRVTVFAVAWSDNGTIDISVPATIMLT